jgi:hypothetical protein
MGAYEEYWHEYRKLRGSQLKQEQARLRRVNPGALGAQTVMVQKNLFSKLKRLYHDIAGVDDWCAYIDASLEYSELVDLARDRFGAIFPSKVRELQRAREEEFMAEQKDLVSREIDKIILDVTYDTLVEIYDLKPEKIEEYQAKHPYIAVREIKRVLDDLVAGFGKKLVDVVIEGSAPVTRIEVVRPKVEEVKPVEKPKEEIKVVTLPSEVLSLIKRAPGRDLAYYERLLRDIEDSKYGLSWEQVSLAIDTIRPIIGELRKEEIKRARERRLPEVEVPRYLPEEVPRRVPTIEIPHAVEIEVKPIKLPDEVALGRELEALAKERFGVEFRFLSGEQKVELYPIALERISKAGKFVSRLPEIEVKLKGMRDKYGRFVFPQEKLYWTLSKEDWEKVYPWSESIPMKVYRAFSEGVLDYGDFEEIGIPKWQVDEWLMYARGEMQRRGLAVTG